MEDRFFTQPVLNSPYEYPTRHWELDATGQPTQRIVERRRSAEFITPIPKPRRKKGSVVNQIVFDEGKGLSTEDQTYDLTGTINLIRQLVDRWRMIPNRKMAGHTRDNPSSQHWHKYPFNSSSLFLSD